MQDLVIKSENGNPVTTSLLIAEKFSKNHKDVLRSIDDLLMKLPEDQCKRNFAPMYYDINQPNGGIRKERYVVMTRDGFTILVMGFTGDEALKFKVDYIEAFNQMEQALKSKVSLPQDYLTALRALVQSEEQKQIAEAMVTEMKPKALYHDEVLKSESLITTTVIAKELGMSAEALNKKLHALNIQFKVGGTWVLYAKYQNRGYTKTKTHVHSDGKGTSIQTYWTEIGRNFVHSTIKGHYVYSLGNPINILQSDKFKTKASV